MTGANYATFAHPARHILVPRIPRQIIPNLPHHITQRGNRRLDIFFDEQDRAQYLFLLHEYFKKYGISLLAYCLMTNHVHLAVLPSDTKGLSEALRIVHTKYATRINRRHEWKGHLFQERFFSSACSPAFFHRIIRYIELNPVRAGIVRKAEEHVWSSAAAHCGIKTDYFLEAIPSFLTQSLPDKERWAPWLAALDDHDENLKIREACRKSLKLGESDARISS